MRDKDIEDLRAAIAALGGQSATLGDPVGALATVPLRSRLAIGGAVNIAAALGETS